MKNSILFFYICSLLTGATALVLQVVWNRYLTQMIGGDSLAQAMSVGVFLLGLSLGYFYWGKYSQKLKNPSLAIYFYALCEIFIAVWCLTFPSIYELGQKMHTILPKGLFSDFITSSFLILSPAFFMGGTIPLLTTGLPGSIAKVSQIHSKVYGFNTLGAGVGVLVGGFYLLPNVGLLQSLKLVSIINFLVGTLVLFIPRRVHKKIDFEPTTTAAKIDYNPLTSSKFFLYATSLFSGLWIIGFEVICFRFLSLSLGSSLFIYPMVVGIFVIGLGCGAISFHQKNPPENGRIGSLTKNLGAAALLFALTLPLFPYLNLWTNFIGQNLRTMQSGYELSLLLNFLLYGVLIFPVPFFAGRILPELYSLFPKNQSNFSRVCGNIYFFNALGCLIGSLGFGYVAYRYVSLEFLLKSLILLGLIYFLYLLWAEQKKTAMQWVSALILLILITPLNRNADIITLNTFTAPLPLLQIPRPPGELIHLNDDTLATISIVKHPAQKEIIPPMFGEDFFYSVHLNGKNESSTYPDLFSTSQVALIPYVMTPKKSLRVAVVGLGTGTTAGLLGRLPNVERVDVIEISKGLVAAAKLIKTQNFDVLENSKVHIIEEDAFKFFKYNLSKYDIVISEPSAIWALGSESLYSLEFYQLVKGSLSEHGIFMNWIHLYNNNKENIFLALRTQFQEFKYVRSFLLAGGVDLGMLVTNKPVEIKHKNEHFQNPVVKDFMDYYGIKNPQNLFLNQVFEWSREDFFSLDDPTSRELHTLDKPILAYLGFKSRFYKQFYDFFRDGQLLNTKLNSENWSMYSKSRSQALLTEFKSRENFFVEFCKSSRAKLINPNCSFITYLYKQYWLPANSSNSKAFQGLKHFGILPSNTPISALKSRD